MVSGDCAFSDGDGEVSAGKLHLPLPPSVNELYAKTCEACGNQFSRPPKYSTGQWAGRRFCSQKCGRRASARTPFTQWDFALKKCQGCGTEFTPKSGANRYCDPCRVVVKKKHYRAFYDRNRSEILKFGAGYRDAARARQQRSSVENNKETLQGMADVFSQNINLEWVLRVKVPFTYAASKNSRYGFGEERKIYTRNDCKAFRQAVAFSLKAALARVGQTVVSGKLWVSLFVQKPNHNGDAVNVVDVVCDAIQDAIGLNDRWYSIKHLDWQICLDDPHIFIEIGQEYLDAHYLCSGCGSIKPESEFARVRAATLARYCLKCRL